MILVGKASGKPTYGCPFCSASSPSYLDGDLYCLGDLIELNKVRGNYYWLLSKSYL